tara:strand:- start:1451 stop:2500 length:1050 start_codon:yes stop_codon:yes gene_type:complete
MSTIIFVVIKYASKKNENYLNFFYVITLLIFLFFIIEILFFKKIQEIFLLDIKNYLIFISIFGSFLIIYLSLPFAILQFKKKIITYSIISSLPLYFKLSFLVIFIYFFNLTIDNLILIVFSTIVVSILVSYISVFKDIFLNSNKKVDFDFIKTLPSSFSFSFFYYLGFTIFFNMDIPLSRIYLDFSDYGSYAAASTIAKIPFYLFSILMPLILPELFNKNKGNKSIQYLFISVLAISAFCIIMIYFSYFHSDFIVSFTFGDSYLSDINYLFLLVLSFFMICLFNSYLIYLLSTNNLFSPSIYFVGLIIFYIFLKFFSNSINFAYLHLMTSTFILIVCILYFYFYKIKKL